MAMPEEERRALAEQSELKRRQTEQLHRRIVKLCGDGMNDTEIAERLSLNRLQVMRIRRANGIRK